MNIIILGPQGSGKGTQAKLLAEKLNLFYFESGKFLRKLAESDERINEIVNKKGGLIPDKQMFSLFSDFLDKKKSDGQNILLDGFPRSLKQYALLKNWLNQKGQKINSAILLNISERESIRRLSARRICAECGTLYNLITNPPPTKNCKCSGVLIQREDDRPEAIKKRLTAYKRQTEPLIDLLRKEGILIEVDGERPIEIIHKNILARLNQRR